MLNFLFIQAKEVRQIYPILSILLLLFVCSCEKEPGPGGNSTIRGKVIINEISNSGNILAEYEAPEERVYIIYGDNDIYDDEVRTSFDGQFKFENLFPGDYSVFVYSDCLNCPSGKETVMQSIEISDNGETYTFSEDFISNKN